MDTERKELLKELDEAMTEIGERTDVPWHYEYWMDVASSLIHDMARDIEELQSSRKADTKPQQDKEEVKC